VNAIKDLDEPTTANLDSYLAKFKEADVDGIIIGGDTAYDEDAIEAIVEHLASAGVPVYAIIGNAESTGSWNHALQAAYEKMKNILNLNLIRSVSAEGFDLVSLPGYFDRKYAAHIAPCLYTPDDAGKLSKLVVGLNGPTFLICHGPPKQSGKLAIDYSSSGTNVGDPDLVEAITAAKIPFGIFGHIVEAGGRATDLTGKKEVKPGTLVDSFYLNPGSANSVVWGLNGGGETYGMAAIVTVQGKKAKYDMIRSPKPKTPQ
jgi:Icc-related predicted phosphoesterase